MSAALIVVGILVLIVVVLGLWGVGIYNSLVSLRNRFKNTFSQIDVQLVRKTRLIGLPELRSQPALAGMIILRRGNRLSITPVTPAEWKAVLKLEDVK